VPILKKVNLGRVIDVRSPQSSVEKSPTFTTRTWVAVLFAEHGDGARGDGLVFFHLLFLDAFEPRSCR